MTAPPPGCDSHASLGAEMRAVAVLAMDRIGPVLDRIRSDPAAGGPAAAGPPDGPAADSVGGHATTTASETTARPGRGARGPQTADTCTVCPVCAIIAVLRGERPELAVRLADHAAGLLAVLQAALDEGGSIAEGTAPEGARSDGPAAPTRRVQHIRVDRPEPVARC